MRKALKGGEVRGREERGWRREGGNEGRGREKAKRGRILFKN